MAAYAALLSLKNTIDQIQNHPRPPISLDTLKIEPLMERVVLLMQFLENYTIDDADSLEGRMVDAAQEAEDIIESYIVDHIEAPREDNISSNNGSLYRYLQKVMIQILTLCINYNSLNKDDSLYGELQKVTHDLDSITTDVAAVKEKARPKFAPYDDGAMVGSDDVMNSVRDKLNNSRYSEGYDSVMNDIMDKLANQQSGRRIIAIAGMGGIGKTTLAKSIYEHPFIVEYFDIRGWATVSQEFDSKRILLQVLDCLKTIGSEDNEHEELGKKLYQSLYGRRYLIVMDDIWDPDAWYEVKRFFPVNNNESKVLITTRPLKLAFQLDGPEYFEMRFLKVDESWNLLRRCVFHEQECPPELEEIGKDIAMKCRGLPLSIVVIGGLLAKSERTQQNWQHVAENLSSIVNLEDDERCFRILQLSYNQLPVHLKPCFLYMAMYPEDYWIHVPTLIKLWVAEGFVKPVAGKSLEKVARVNLNDLVVRSLVLIRTWSLTRGIKRCTIHDLLRDLCIKEAKKYKFFRTMGTMHNPDHDKNWRAQRRIGIHHAGKYIPRPLPEAVRSASRTRTLVWNVDGILPSVVPFRLLRVVNASKELQVYDEERTRPLEDFFHPINLRHLVARAKLPVPEFPKEFYRFWNLQMLIVDSTSMDNDGPVLDIWHMPQLRHVKIHMLQLTDPPPAEEFENGWMILENLETLQTIRNLRLGEEVLVRIPNMKKLGLWYSRRSNVFGLYNLCQLRNLEALSCSIDLRTSELTRDLMIAFPSSLRKLSLEGTRISWEEMGTKIGWLPYLEALHLGMKSCVGPKWDTSDGGFQKLKFLGIRECEDLEQWRSDATHFPCLEQLHLMYLPCLEDIPGEFVEMVALRSIEVVSCTDSVVLSAKDMLEEHKELLGEEMLQIKVFLSSKNQLRKENLVSPNFTVY